MSTFTFGKYKGQTVVAVNAEHPDYLQWLAKQERFKESPVYAEVTRVLGLDSSAAASSSGPSTGMPTHVPSPAGTVSFGKYRGQPPATLLADKAYCQWVFQQDFFKRNALYTDVAKLLGQTGAVNIYEQGSSGIVVPGEGDTVVFGKYKGQSLTSLLADTDYCQFLMKQTWFKTNAVYFKVKKVVETTPAASEAGSSTASAYIYNQDDEPYSPPTYDPDDEPYSPPPTPTHDGDDA